MTFNDFSDFCRLCLIPLNDSYIDCANDENYEVKDTIKMVYNIDIEPDDEYSTKVCLMCCNVLMYNTIHYVRAVEVQKSLTRVQRIKNKILNFGKKKRDKNMDKKPLPDSPLIDIEMIEIEPARDQMYTKATTIEDFEMESIAPADIITPDPPPDYTEFNPPMFFANLTSFKQNQWSATNQAPVQFDNAPVDNSMKQSDILPSQMKCTLDENNNSNNSVKQSPSLFQMAKNFCGNIMKRHKPNADAGLDEITDQMASLRFTA